RLHLRLFFYSSFSRSPLALHSFPTRRSSDLAIISIPPVEAPHLRVIPTPTAAMTPPKTAFNKISFDTLITGIISIKNDIINTLKDRKSTRLNSSHVKISYAVFCLKKKIHILH